LKGPDNRENVSKLRWYKRFCLMARRNSLRTLLSQFIQFDCVILCARTILPR